MSKGDKHILGRISYTMATSTALQKRARKVREYIHQRSLSEHEISTLLDFQDDLLNQAEVLNERVFSLILSLSEAKSADPEDLPF